MDIRELSIEELREAREQSYHSAVEYFNRACLYGEYARLSGQRTRQLTGATIGSACVSGYMKINEDVSPLAASVSAGITLVFAFAACYQKYKEIYCREQRREFQSFSFIANENTAVYSRELFQRRRSPALRLVQNE